MFDLHRLPKSNLIANLNPTMQDPKIIRDPERTIESDLTPHVMSRIGDANKLIDIYGAWPTFEDAEIVSVVLDRGNHKEIIVTGDWAVRVPPSLTAKVILFDSRYGGLDARRKYRLVTLRFNGISRLNMELFGYQNPVMGIGLRAEPAVGDADPSVHVEWGGTVMGHEADFTCESIDVLSVEPFHPPESANT
jgi:hypothetical protein